MDNTKLVPFGKYKEQPIEILLEDTNYTEWILSNNGIKENYSWVYNAIKSAISNGDTPEHNKMQSRFLQQKYCAKIAQIFCKVKGYKLLDSNPIECNKEKKHTLNFEDDLSTLAEKLFNDNFNNSFVNNETITKIIKFNESYYYFMSNDNVKIIIIFQNNKITIREYEDNYDDVFNDEKTYYNAIFEKHNIDVLYAIPIKNEDDNYLRIELKPIISDDYPNVLRKATKQQINLVLCDMFKSSVASFEEVVEIFKRSNIVLLKSPDINTLQVNKINEYALSIKYLNNLKDTIGKKGFLPEQEALKLIELVENKLF